MIHLQRLLKAHPWLIQVTAVFALWRVVLFGLGALAPQFLAYDPSFPYSDIIFSAYNLPQWLYSWANFDGVHYLTIIEKGYHAVNYIQAFFPMFPGMVMGMNLAINSALLNGLLISNLMGLIVCMLWFYFLKTEYSQRLAWVGLLVLLAFPTSFFLGAFYGESLFLACVLGAFLAARKQHWLVAGTLVAVASATRVVGIFLVPALALEWLLQYQGIHKTWPRPSIKLLTQSWSVCTGLVIGCLGLLTYMAYLQLNFGDALYFFHVQSEFGAGRQESLVLYPQVAWRYLKILITARPFDLKYLAYLQEFAAGTAGLALLGLAILKKIRWSYLVFALAAFFLPTLTGTFSSLSRYLLVCFPIFMVIAEYLHNRPKLMVGYLLLSTLILVVNVMLFIQGYWVA